jgi:hypothetical protein
VISVFAETASTRSENLTFYVVDDTASNSDYAELRSEYKRQMTLINDQDMDILTNQQATRRSLGVEHCRFAPHWDELGMIFHARLAQAHNL